MLRLFTFFIATFLFLNCSNSDGIADAKPEPGEDLPETTITEMQDLMLKLGEDEIIVDTPSADQLISIMLDVSSKRRENVQMPGKIRKAAEAAIFLRRYDDGVTLFQNLYNNYPESELAPFALFHIGFTYDEHIGDKEKAASYYDAFLKKYPNHEFASSVKELKMYIDKTPMEVFEELRERGQGWDPKKDEENNE
jgi:tetratricopeptide (TPR) repeat protein